MIADQDNVAPANDPMLNGALQHPLFQLSHQQKRNRNDTHKDQKRPARNRDADFGQKRDERQKQRGAEPADQNFNDFNAGSRNTLEFVEPATPKAKAVNQARYEPEREIFGNSWHR